MIVWDGVCREDCPPEAPFREVNECVKKCSYKRLYVYNNQCFDNCKEIGKKVNKVLYANHKECVEVCPDNKFKYNGICYLSCPYFAPFYDKNKNCLGTCPLDDPYDINFECTRSCANTRYNKIYKTTCYESCPLNTFVNDSLCVDECPAYKAYYNNKNECLEYCPQNNVVHDYECIDIVNQNRILKRLLVLNDPKLNENGINRLISDNTKYLHQSKKSELLEKKSKSLNKVKNPKLNEISKRSSNSTWLNMNLMTIFVSVLIFLY